MVGMSGFGPVADSQLSDRRARKAELQQATQLPPVDGLDSLPESRRLFKRRIRRPSGGEANSTAPLADQPGIRAGAEVTNIVDAARDDEIVQRATTAVLT